MDLKVGPVKGESGSAPYAPGYAAPLPSVTDHISMTLAPICFCLHRLARWRETFPHNGGPHVQMNYLYIYFPLERGVQAAISVRLPGPLIGCDRGGGDDVTFCRSLFVRLESKVAARDCLPTAGQSNMRWCAFTRL